MIVIDPDTGTILFSTQAAIDFYGYKNLIGMNIGEINRLTADEIKIEMGKAEEEKRNFFRFKHKLADGRIKDVEVNSYPMIYKEKSVLVSRIRDVTDENILIKNSNRLKYLVIFLLILFASVLVYMVIILKIKITEAEKANQDKNKFLSIISHDLRNPIYGLKEILRLINRDWEDLEEDQKKYNFQILFESSEKISQLLENLLLWSKSKTGKISVEKTSINIKDLIEKSIFLYKNNYTQKKITVENQVVNDIYVSADYNMIDTVIRNLINNAIKFTKENGQIIIDSVRNNNSILINISDTGVGIKKANLNKLFKLDTAYRKKGTKNEPGSGLGLILCKEFLEKNYAELLVKSEENVGTTFSIKFNNI